jgi:hypothetical protein
MVKMMQEEWDILPESWASQYTQPRVVRTTAVADNATKSPDRLSPQVMELAGAISDSMGGFE